MSSLKMMMIYVLVYCNNKATAAIVLKLLGFGPVSRFSSVLKTSKRKTVLSYIYSLSLRTSFCSKRKVLEKQEAQERDPAFPAVQGIHLPRRYLNLNSISFPCFIFHFVQF